MKSALVVSPFASTPRDAGHRRRVHQMTRVLRDAGYRLHFLLFAFEEAWAWSHDQACLDALRADWGDVSVVYAGKQVGLPPKDGRAHALDEWWDPALGMAVENLCERRFFDVAVVHNVWLSKAFDFIRGATTKVLETHDLFWRRAEVFARMGTAPEFFVCDRDAEVFGIDRADIVVTIQAAEAKTLLGLTRRRVVNVPFYDPALEAGAEAGPARLRDPEMVTFGFLGSANPFNAHGVNALLASLERAVARSFAPVDVVVGGAVGALVHSALPVRCVGRVASEAAFYAGVDHVIAPVFEGTGFKIKTADALALARPMLVSAHAAEGVAIDKSLVCATPDAMAAEMVEISLQRPEPAAAQARVRAARDELRRRTEEGEAAFLRAIAHAASPLVVDLRDVDPEVGALKLQSWIGPSRGIAARRPMLLIVGEAVRAIIERHLPPGVRAIAPALYDARRDEWPRRVVIDATEAGAGRTGLLRDARLPLHRAAAGALAELPLLHADVIWEAAAQRLREAWRASPTGRRALAGPRGLIVIRDARAAPAARGEVARFVDAGDPQAGATLIMRLLAGGRDGIELVWAAAPSRLGEAIAEACALTGVPFSGAVDGVAIAPGRFDPAIAADRGRSAAATLGRIAFHEEAPCPLP